MHAQFGQFDARTILTPRMQMVIIRQIRNEAGNQPMAQSAALDNETIYQTLVQEILHFRHRPGDMISENTLCQRFGVSRTPARSVLQRLQENGRLECLPEKLRQTALLRLQYPEMSLSQLAEKCDPPVTKSCMNHRMRKLLEEAKKL